MAVSEAQLKENYRQLPDEKLLRIAAEDGPRLRPEARVLLQEELSTRGLLAKVEKTLQAQRHVLTEAGLAEYCELLRRLPCPICQSSAQPLNATLSSRVLSFLVVTTWKKKLAIACPACLDRLNREASLSSALLGWWGLPWGIIRTVQALAENGKMAKTNHLPYPNDLLKAFVIGNVNDIEAAREQAGDLRALLPRA